MSFFLVLLCCLSLFLLAFHLLNYVAATKAEKRAKQNEARQLIHKVLQERETVEFESAVEALDTDKQSFALDFERVAWNANLELKIMRHRGEIPSEEALTDEEFIAYGQWLQQERSPENGAALRYLCLS